MLFYLSVAILSLHIANTNSWLTVFPPKISFTNSIQMYSVCTKKHTTNRHSSAKNESILNQGTGQKMFGKLKTAFLASIIFLYPVSNCVASNNAVSSISTLDLPKYQKSLLNIPSNDFWYPPYLLGLWKSDFKFINAEFSDKVPVEKLAQDNIVPGFKKYSVFMYPEMGKDITTTLKFVQLDSHPSEDHSYNLRKLMSAFTACADRDSDGAVSIDSTEETVIDSAPYSYQNADGIFPHPWKIRYHDKFGDGEVEVKTTKRDINVYSGIVETNEFVRQTHTRRDIVSGTSERIIGDYAINWKLSVPEGLRDQYITEYDLSKASRVIGKLEVAVYLQPTNDLYLKLRGKPAGVFTYEVNMERIRPVEMNKITYPFVKMNDGPVEIQDYFGY